jgi:hypothetical protein
MLEVIVVEEVWRLTVTTNALSYAIGGTGARAKYS